MLTSTCWIRFSLPVYHIDNERMSRGLEMLMKGIYGERTADDILDLKSVISNLYFDRDKQAKEPV